MRILPALSNISFKSRISLILVLVSLISCIVIGMLGWTSGRNALERTINNQLTSIREAQAFQLESYFEQLVGQSRTLAENRMIVNAMQQFNAGFNVGLQSSLTIEEDQELRDFYSDVFMKRMSDSFETPSLAIVYEPRTAVASYFQYHYMVKNPFPPGRKDMMSGSQTDQTIYAKFHNFYHPLFRGLQQEFNYYDIFLIDMKSLSINYSVFKETDFATSLIDGPYQDSALGLLAKKIRAQPTRGEVHLADYRPYSPSYGAPAAFLGTAIYDGNEATGILAIQIRPDQINKSMTYDQGWQRSGLGQTGETYIVGGDKLMRSDARKLLESQNSFFSDLDAVGLLDETLQSIRNFGTTNTLMPAVSQAVSAALERQSGTIITQNYMGEPVLSAYAPVDIPGLNWVILAEMGVEEAFGPIAELQQNIIVWGVVLILLVSLLSMLVSRSVVKPIDALATGVSKLSSGQEDVEVSVDSNDEFGALARNFNTMVSSIREKSRVIDEKTQENARLLNNILPRPIIERIQAGEQVADELQQVTVAYLQVAGLSEGNTLSQQAKLLEELIERLEELAESYEVERIKTIGNTLIFGCGVTRSRLDHSRQTVDFAADALELTSRINADNRSALSLKIGIAAGPLNSAVVGSKQYHYEIWGSAADQAARIRFAAQPGSILVTDAVRQKIDTAYELSSGKSVEMDNGELRLHRVLLEEVVA